MSQTRTMPSEIDVRQGAEDVSARLLASAATLSFDPEVDIDWAAPVREELFGLNPHWSTLYGTPLWDAMTPAQRVTLTRHEVASIMSTAIWLEMILQQMVLRDFYTQDHSSAEFRFALTEIADECRHSAMFARVCQTLGATGYVPGRWATELGRLFKTVAVGEVAYAAILVAEEVLDVMQRDWMRGTDVLPVVRRSSEIHVVEESRHMAYARQEIRRHIGGQSAWRRKASGLLIALAAWVIVSAMVNDRVYAAAGLDPTQAVAAAKANEHRRSMLRGSCTHLMDFLSEVGLLSRSALAVYRRADMI